MGYGTVNVGYQPKPKKTLITDGTATVDSSGIIQVTTTYPLDDKPLIKFFAPCDSKDAAGIAFNGGATLKIMDTTNRSVAGLAGIFAEGAAVTVQLDDAGQIAYIQSVSNLSGSLITVTFDGGFAGQEYTIAGGGETYKGIIPRNNIVNQWVIPINTTYTVSAQTADGQSWSNTVETGEWFTWYQVTVNGYFAPIESIPSQNGVLTYNGQTQSPIWNNYDPSQLIIDGTTSATDAGTYTATFTPRRGYKWSDDSTSAKEVQWSIGKAAGSMNIFPTKMTLTNAEPTGTIEVSRAGTGAISAQSNSDELASVQVDGNIVTVTGHKQGSAVITISVAADDNYEAPASKSCNVTLDFLAVGTSWTYGSNATFTAPVAGQYQVELHGGGGGGGCGGDYDEIGNDYYSGYAGGAGGGSGEIKTVTLRANEQVQITIGAGGAGGTYGGIFGGGTSSQSGTPSSFGSYLTVNGGGGGGKGDDGGFDIMLGPGTTGTSYGSLASGSQGNKNNTSQQYGDGGSGGSGGSMNKGSMQHTPPGGGQNGQPGACIITFLG